MRKFYLIIDLPKDRFRIPYMKRFVKVTLFLKDMPAFSWDTYDLVRADTASYQKESMIFDRIIENEYIQLKVQENGSLRFV